MPGDRQKHIHTEKKDHYIDPVFYNYNLKCFVCADTDANVAKYSCLHNNDQLYMAKYLTYMPTQEELRREIEQQKMIFALKSGKEKA